MTPQECPPSTPCRTLRPMKTPLSTNIAQKLIKRLAQEHNLVTREEFDAQARLLAASEAKIQELENLIDELEKQMPPNQQTAPQ